MKVRGKAQRVLNANTSHNNNAQSDQSPHGDQPQQHSFHIPTDSELEYLIKRQYIPQSNPAALGSSLAIKHTPRNAIDNVPNTNSKTTNNSPNNNDNNYEIILVLDRVCDLLNHQSCARIASTFGIPNVFIVLNELSAKNRQVDLQQFQGSDLFLNQRYFNTSNDCLEAIRGEGYELWVSTLSPTAIPLSLDYLTTATTMTKEFFTNQQHEQQQPQISKSYQDFTTQLHELLPTIPKKLAIVIGREADGVSEVLIQNSDRQVYLPMYGFAESLNVSVAGALLLHRLTTLIEFQRDVEMQCAELELDSPYATKQNGGSPTTINETGFISTFTLSDTVPSTTENSDGDGSSEHVPKKSKHNNGRENSIITTLLSPQDAPVQLTPLMSRLY